jgi:RNA polymerase sigma factor (sigma-70 family)
VIRESEQGAEGAGGAVAGGAATGGAATGRAVAGGAVAAAPAGRSVAGVDLGFEGFYRREFPAAVRLAGLLTGSQSAAEDVVQDAMSGVYRSYDSLRAPQAYLRRSVVNGARSWLRDERRRREKAERAGLAEERNREPAEAGRELLEAIHCLPYRQQVVVVARYWGGWSEADIAAALGCRTGTVKSLGSRAMARLRAEVD